MQYRPDIDGLRAVAVLSVISFHLKFGATGGYIGVDIFFVISGFLISGVIYDQIRIDGFSIVKFYERRARRILPALIATIVASYFIALRAFYPSELTAFAKSALASILFVANIYFFNISDYFAPAANTITLLHLWSLGIEEQFYILFPLLVVFFARHPTRKLLPALVVMLIASAGGSQLMLNMDPSAAFYLLPYRAFELLLGCLIALPPLRPQPQSRVVAEMIAVLGTICLVSAIAWFGPQTSFPGFAALLPCVGTALIIWTGQTVRTTISKVLAAGPLVYVGKISYSLYLIHWPVIVFGSHLFAAISPIIVDISTFVASIVLAAFSYRFVEQPFRQPSGERNSLRILSVSAFSIVAVTAVSAYTVYEDGFGWRTDDQTRKVLSYLSYDYRRVYRSGECFLDPDQDFKEADVSRCLPDGSGIHAMLWGDSHAIDLYPGLRISMRRKGYSLGVLASSACAPIIGYTIASRPLCPSFNNQALPTILAVKPRFVILSASWNLLAQTMDQLDATVEDLAKQGIKVVILGQSPRFKELVPKTIAGRFQNEESNTMISAEGLDLSRADSDRIMSARFDQRANIKFIPMMELMCPQLQCSLVTDDGTPIYWDAEHLTEDGSHIFAERLTPLILQ